MGTSKRCSAEVRERAVRLVAEQRGQHGSQWAAIQTTVPDTTSVRPAGLVARRFVAQRPNQLWAGDFTYVATWKGFVFVAFVIDVYSRMIVGWRVSTSMKADLVLDALEQAIHVRSDVQGLIHHSDRGTQYLSIRCRERLAECGMQASVGTTGDSYDNALAESIKTVYSKPKRFIVADHGVMWMRWSSLRSNGSIGLTIDDCFNRSATFHRSSWRISIISNRLSRWPRESQPEFSGKAGAVHSAARRSLTQHHPRIRLDE